MLAKKFASNFMPVFKASDLARFCNLITRKEKTELEFVLKYAPFSKFKSKLINSKRKTFPFVTPLADEKKKIKKEWEKEFADPTNIKFDDKKVLEKLVAEQEMSSSESDTDMNEQTVVNYIKEKFQKNSYSNTLMLEIRTERGRQLERNIIEKINLQENMNFVLDGSDRRMEFNGLYAIKGRIDGIDINSRTIIEIKTKSKVDHSSSTMELRERIQCLAYMKLSGMVRTLFVETDPNGIMKIIKIDYDETEFVDRIDKGLLNFSNKYRNLNENEFRKLMHKYYR